MRICQITPDEVLRWQRTQYKHDKRNHGDILCLHKTERLKHYGLHFAKYVGRFARGASEHKTTEQTFVDIFLVCLSAANTLHQRLVLRTSAASNDPFRDFADASGRFADACEKIDHLEDFVSLAREANIDLFNWVIEMSIKENIDIFQSATESRRKQLRERMFYNDEPV